MTSSGTYNFNPAASDMVLTAFSRCGKSGAVLTAEHLFMASNEANLQNVEWVNRGYQLWKSELIQFPPAATLTQGVATYALPATTISVTMAFIRINPGVVGAQSDRVMGPLSATEYAAITNKLNQGRPTSYWFDRQVAPTMSLWPVPDSAGPYTGLARVFQQIQDVVVPAGVTLDAPYRFFDAFVAGLAARLAVHYAPERLGSGRKNGMPGTGTGLLGAYDEAWDFATTRDTENVALNILPALGRYFRP